MIDTVRCGAGPSLRRSNSARGRASQRRVRASALSIILPYAVGIVPTPEVGPPMDRRSTPRSEAQRETFLAWMFRHSLRPGDFRTARAGIRTIVCRMGRRSTRTCQSGCAPAARRSDRPLRAHVQRWMQPRWPFASVRADLAARPETAASRSELGRRGGGKDAATQRFADKTREPLTGRLPPIVTRATERNRRYGLDPVAALRGCPESRDDHPHRAAS